jgi:hypothetical protein
MSEFREPKVLWQVERVGGERLQLEQDEYNGRPTFALRRLIHTPNGWRWSKIQPDAKGRAWAVLRLKPEDLRELGAALIAAAGGLPEPENARTRQLEGLMENRRQRRARREPALDLDLSADAE